MGLQLSFDAAGILERAVPDPPVAAVGDETNPCHCQCDRQYYAAPSVGCTEPLLVRDDFGERDDAPMGVGVRCVEGGG